jgi:extracellular factor (EF) 3-hydroxypalmitic acid methyl ester biosynthesis protein
MLMGTSSTSTFTVASNGDTRRQGRHGAMNCEPLAAVSLHPGSPTVGPSACKRLERVVNEFVSLQEARLPDDARYLAVVSGMHALGAATREVEIAGLSPEQIAHLVAPARRAHAESPLVQRFQTWPRGYAGDFETIEWLSQSRNEATPGTFGYCVERCALNSDAAQQHRNKVHWQAERVDAMCWTTETPRVLSIGCGGSLDLRKCRPLLRARAARVVLNDYDQHALDLSCAALPEIQITTVPGDIFRAIRHVVKHGPYDLVLAGGLFDYLADDQLEWLLPKLMQTLTLRGRLCFTNLADDNPFRAWMTYFAGWSVIHRSVNDVSALPPERWGRIQSQWVETRPVWRSCARSLPLPPSSRCSRAPSRGEAGLRVGVEPPFLPFSSPAASRRSWNIGVGADGRKNATPRRRLRRFAYRPQAISRVFSSVFEAGSWPGES